MTRQYIGVDLHKAFFQACALGVGGERLWEGRYARDGAGMKRFHAQVSGDTVLAVEACGPTWSFVDARGPTGARVCVVDPRKTRLKAGYAAKTDRLDARRLADARRRESVVSIYIPPPAIRDVRELCRGRHQVVRLRMRAAQMIRALLLRCDGGDPPTQRLYSQHGLAWFAARHLTGQAEAALRRLERLFRVMHEEAQAADALVNAHATADPIAIALDTMVGIGPVRALTIRAEVGDITRFRRGAELASYAGLVPRVDSSADRYDVGRITRAGSPWLRYVLVEAATNAMRRTDAVGRWARALAIRKGVNKARVALARRLCDEIVATWPRSA